MDPAEYCREIETYLCRKNEGHLIRIVGPAFEQVCGWAAQGVPLKIAFRGIDRYCERYYAKGPKRRPVRIEFCEADILELFDDWRRAVGVSAATDASTEPVAREQPAERPSRKPALASHIDRAVARLIGLRAATRSAAFVAAVSEAVAALDAIAAQARKARGEVRTRMIDQLAEIDRTVMAAALRDIDAATAATLRREAEAEMAPFGARMAPDARARAIDTAYARLVREALGLPVIAFE